LDFAFPTYIYTHATDLQLRKTVSLFSSVGKNNLEREKRTDVAESMVRTWIFLRENVFNKMLQWVRLPLANAVWSFLVTFY